MTANQFETIQNTFTKMPLTEYQHEISQKPF